MPIASLMGNNMLKLEDTFQKEKNFVLERAKGGDRSKENRGLAYLRTDIGNYALIPPVSSSEYPTARNFLVRMKPETVEEHRTELKKAETECTVARTGAKFCLFRWDGNELAGVQMGHPACEMSKMVEEGIPEREASKECIREGKEAYLVVSCHPEEICKPGGK